MDRNIGSFLFYVSLGKHTDSIDQWCCETLALMDPHILLNTAVIYGEAGNLGDFVSKLNVSFPLLPQLRSAAERELSQTIRMQKLYRSVVGLCKQHDIEAIPLKGADPRIAALRGAYNPMLDLDVLVRETDIEKAGTVLIGDNWQFVGKTSGAHMTFHKNEHILELHWDLINRYHPVQGTLFHPDINGVFDRCVSVEDSFLLSLDDLIAYLISHGVKEYFHKPKWLTDIEKICRTYHIDHNSIQIFTEWGVLRSIGVLRGILGQNIMGSGVPDLPATGCALARLFEKMVSQRMISSDNKRILRPVLWGACAENKIQMIRMLEKSIRRGITHL